MILPGRYERAHPEEGGALDVVVTCFNDGHFLGDALSSLGSDRQAGEGIVIVNDGSTDRGTLKVLDQLRSRGFQVIDQPNSGLPAARNTGWRSSKAEHILFLDADNMVEPEYLTRAADVLQASSDVAFVYADRLEFGDRERRVDQRIDGISDLLVGNRIDACAVVRRKVLEELNGFDEAMRSGYEDWEFWIRVLANGHQAVHLPEPYVHYRVRRGSLLSTADDPVHRAAIVRYVTDKHQVLFATHARHVITELHRIQAHDRQLIVQARKVGDEALRTAEDARRSAAGSEKELQEARIAMQDMIGEHRRVVTDLEDRLSGSEKANASLAEAFKLLELRKEELAEEAHRLVGELDKVMRALDIQREHANGLRALLTQYEERIRRMEDSKLWRMRKQYHKMRALLRTSSGTSSRGWKWMRRTAFMVSSKGRRILRKFLAKVFRALYLLTEERRVRILVEGEGVQDLTMVQGDPYHQWMAANFARSSDLRDQREEVLSLRDAPLISVVMPVFDPPIEALEQAIRSVLGQTYSNLELCIADDRSKDPAVRELLERYMAADKRVRVTFRRTNGHISAASNSALELAKGSFVALMDHDDLLAPDALFHVVRVLQRNKELDLIYTDEDKVDEAGRHSDPHFKPQWCPDHLLSRNYFGHLVVLRRTIVEELGGFRKGFEGSQDYDLMLRFTERSQRIHRIPKVLYHWRIHSASAASGEDAKPYAYDAAKRALNEALVRRGEPGRVRFLDGYRGYSVRFDADLKGRVSVIIPTKDKADVLSTCLRSVLQVTDHPDFEVVVLSNGSKERSLFQLFEAMEREHGERFKWHAADMAFNFSALMNLGAGMTRGDHLLYLNNDTEVTRADWMRAMHEWSQRPQTGAVGVKLLYHNDTIQHAGVVIGLGGVAGHTFVGQAREGPGYFNYINTINNYSAVTAACMMVERSKVEAIGGWDEQFTVEYNDVDLCLRLAEKGYHNVYLPHVELYHYESLTRGHPHMTKESYERHLREVGLFKERWSELIADDPCYNPNLTRGAHDFRVGP
ncbi:MAG: glycosyltransferase [Flavobacteriales bacterium]|nr:glycosyltransferase [Flavobacteriales bacterium]